MKFVALKFLTDEDFDNRIVRGLLLRDPELDIVRVQDVGLGGSTDPENLAFAASQGRILLTHDVSTIPGYVKERLEAGERVPGIFEVPQAAPIGTVIEDLLLLAESSQPNEWEGQIIYLPL